MSKVSGKGEFSCSGNSRLDKLFNCEIISGVKKYLQSALTFGKSGAVYLAGQHNCNISGWPGFHKIRQIYK